MSTFWAPAFNASALNTNILDFSHQVHEIRPFWEQTSDTADKNNLLPAARMNGRVPFDDKSGITKKELLTFYISCWH